MTEQTSGRGATGITVPPVQREITVQAPVERAFAVFTQQQTAWWPMSYHIGEQEPETVVVESGEGGRWFERAADGTECDWGRVLVWDPPRRLTLSWQINGDWQFEPDVTKGSEIEVSFTPEGAGATRVRLEHRALERHGEGAASMRQSVDGPDGWGGILESFAKAV